MIGDGPAPALAAIASSFRFPDPATTSMGFDFSDDDDCDNGTDNGTDNDTDNDKDSHTHTHTDNHPLHVFSPLYPAVPVMSQHSAGPSAAFAPSPYDSDSNSNIFRSAGQKVIASHVTKLYPSNGSDSGRDFNPFKPLARHPALQHRPAASAAATARATFSGSPVQRFSSADLRNQLEALEKLIMSEEEDKSDDAYKAATQQQRPRKSSAAVVDEYLKRKESSGSPVFGLNEIPPIISEEAKKAHRNSARQSTQSLLQFLLDSRQAIAIAASSPLPSPTSNIFRGTDFISKNANRMSTAISVQSSKGNRLSYAAPLPAFGTASSVSSWTQSDNEVNDIERELAGELDSDGLDSTENDFEHEEDLTDDAADLDGHMRYLPSGYSRARKAASEQSTGLKLQPTIISTSTRRPRTVHDRNNQSHVPHPPSRRPPSTRMLNSSGEQTLKRSSVDMTPEVPPSKVSSESLSPASSDAVGTLSPRLTPDSKRRRSVTTNTSTGFNGFDNSNQRQPCPQHRQPRPHTIAFVPPPPPPPATPPELISGSPTLVDIIVGLTNTHFVHIKPAVSTLLSQADSLAKATTAKVVEELQAAAGDWRKYSHARAVYRVHACAVSQWVMNLEDDLAAPTPAAATTASTGISRNTVHPSAVALYILAMCLFDGIAHVVRADAALAVLVLEMAAGVAVDDGGGRGEEALREATILAAPLAREDADQSAAQQGRPSQSGMQTGDSVEPASPVSPGRVGNDGMYRGPQRRASLRHPPNTGTRATASEVKPENQAAAGLGSSKSATTSGVRTELSPSRPTMHYHYYPLADPAWSLVDSFGHVSREGLPIPRGAKLAAAVAAPPSPKRLSHLQTMTPMEFLRLPTLRLAECYELGRGVKKSAKRAAYYYQVWHALGGTGRASNHAVKDGRGMQRQSSLVTAVHLSQDAALGESDTGSKSSISSRGLPSGRSGPQQRQSMNQKEQSQITAVTDIPGFYKDLINQSHKRHNNGFVRSSNTSAVLAVFRKSFNGHG
ncbi:hypothetical protein HDU83_009180 [Entophlyctis luteolus]|nr:hypothetical protein HDU83_009180 [Entophlyctis luteolus]